MALLGCVSCSFPLSLFRRRFSLHSERVQAAFFSLLFCFPSCFPLHTQYRLFDAVLLLRCVYALKCMDGFFFFSSSASLHSIHTLLFFDSLWCKHQHDAAEKATPYGNRIGWVDRTSSILVKKERRVQNQLHNDCFFSGLILPEILNKSFHWPPSTHSEPPTSSWTLSLCRLSSASLSCDN